MGSDEAVTQANEVELLIAECMAELGFTYVPYEQNFEAWEPYEEAYASPPEEFAEQYGYGISTIQVENLGQPIDPNEEIRATLSPEALDAYQEALYGKMADGGPQGNGLPPFPPPEEQGCRGQAEFDSGLIGTDGTPWGARQSDVYETLAPDFHALMQRFQSHPDLAEAVTRWKECMADAGLPAEVHSNVARPRETVRDRMADLEWGPPTNDGTHEQRDVDPAELAELQLFEIKVAVADFSCRLQHYNDVAVRVQHELEAEFVGDHRDELEHFRDYLIEAYGEASFSSE